MTLHFGEHLVHDGDHVTVEQLLETTSYQVIDCISGGLFKIIMMTQQGVNMKEATNIQCYAEPSDEWDINTTVTIAPRFTTAVHVYLIAPSFVQWTTLQHITVYVQQQ